MISTSNAIHFSEDEVLYLLKPFKRGKKELEMWANEIDEEDRIKGVRMRGENYYSLRSVHSMFFASTMPEIPQEWLDDAGIDREEVAYRDLIEFTEPPEAEAIIKDYLAGKNLRELGRQYGYHPTYLRDLMNHRGLPTSREMIRERHKEALIERGKKILEVGIDRYAYGCRSQKHNTKHQMARHFRFSYKHPEERSITVQERDDYFCEKLREAMAEGGWCDGPKEVK